MNLDDLLKQDDVTRAKAETMRIVIESAVSECRVRFGPTVAKIAEEVYTDYLSNLITKTKLTPRELADSHFGHLPRAYRYDVANKLLQILFQYCELASVILIVGAALNMDDEEEK